MKQDGSVVTWDSADHGGYSDAVKGQLATGVRLVVGNVGAFAAVKDDGSVDTWGFALDGGNSDAVKAELQGGVLQVVGSVKAFAAIKKDGSFVTWGDRKSVCNSEKVKAQLSGGVEPGVGTLSAFAAIKGDGSVVTWGDPDFGAESDAVKAERRCGRGSIQLTCGGSNAGRGLPERERKQRWFPVALAGSDGEMHCEAVHRVRCLGMVLEDWGMGVSEEVSTKDRSARRTVPLRTETCSIWTHCCCLGDVRGRSHVHSRILFCVLECFTTHFFARGGALDGSGSATLPTKQLQAMQKTRRARPRPTSPHPISTWFFIP